MKDVALKRENDREIVFTNRPAAAFLFVLGFVAAGYAIFVLVPGRTRWFLLVLVVVAVVISVGAVLRRQRLVLDLAQRRYLHETGYWPRPQRETGPLTDIEHVQLTTRLRSRTMRPGVGAARQRIWVVSLKFRGEDQPYDLFEERRERKAYARLESLARRLRVPALDRTGPQDKITPWEQLDRPLAARVEAGALERTQVPPLPQGSGIEFHEVPGRRHIILPAHGFALWVPVMYALPVAMIALGVLLLWQAWGASPGAMVFGAVFVVAALVLLFLFSASVFGQEWIAEARDELVFGNALFGYTWRKQRTAKRDVEEIEIKRARFAAADAGRASPVALPEPQEVLLRSKTMLRRFGAHLSSSEREWLRAALTAMVQ